ncbi:YciI family protein [Streptomyces sp. RB6PN25]|uniref:YciI family protein n=1 Tax=Streptomyces humicola TaxID=2953240 RepID=A0ABT1Q504_9ACTN|nr:YciI family protein [Streptomyces humicola]MCQ4085001.1 YciI family protein [Streptomyces humicola]
MPQYLLLIYDDESAVAGIGQEQFDQLLKEHRSFGERNASVLRGGHALEPTTTATSIRKDSTGNVTVTDGPFAETKEALGGFYIVEAADLDEAIAVAKQVPAPYGGVEVRPVRVFDQ